MEPRLRIVSSVAIVLSLSCTDDLLSSVLLSYVAAGIALGGSPLAGPCSTGPVVIEVNSADDIMSRTRYSPTTTVLLYFRKDIQLATGLVFDGNFSCTILMSPDAAGNTVWLPLDTMPVLTIKGANNILINNVDFSLGLTSGSGACATASNLPLLAFKGFAPPVCPAIYVGNSWGIQLTQTAIFGRVDFVNVNNTLVDQVNSTSVSQDLCNIRVQGSGDGPNLGPASASAHWAAPRPSIGIYVVGGSVGTQIANNYFTQFSWAAVQIGQGVHNAGDAMMTRVERNYIYTAPTDKKTFDNTGIYYDTHWVNPGNTASCNYVIGGEHCMYLDYTSSGITVDGGVCINNNDGIKINTGHDNKVSVVSVNPYTKAGWVSAQNWNVNNCQTRPGCWWEKIRAKYYASPAIQSRFPELVNYCAMTSYNGNSCNALPGLPGADVTGNCSGLPTGNVLRTAIVNSQRKTANWPGYLSPGPFDLSLYNQIQFTIYNTSTNASTAFTNAAAGDYSLTPGSRIAADFPGMASCPLGQVGPKPTATLADYWGRFNVPAPVWAAAMPIFQNFTCDPFPGDAAPGLVGKADRD
eukprot:jgi/Mesen1/4132/ME000218S03247